MYGIWERASFSSSAIRSCKTQINLELRVVIFPELRNSMTEPLKSKEEPADRERIRA
jgi:hypothetical protein